MNKLNLDIPNMFNIIEYPLTNGSRFQPKKFIMFYADAFLSFLVLSSL